MKDLKTTIYEKLKVDDIVLDKRFPVDGTLKNIINFLEDNNFIIIKDTRVRSKIFNTAKSKCFTYLNDDNERVWFADTSKKEICKENPIFYINPETKYYEVYYLDSTYHIVKIVEDDKKAFLKELNKRFDW